MRNINELWDEAAEKFAERVAVTYLDDSYTYRELQPARPVVPPLAPRRRAFACVWVAEGRNATWER